MGFITEQRVKNLIWIILLALMLALLAGFMAAGWQSRYLADDYCYDAEFITHGFWAGQIDSYLRLMPYSSNRYSLTLFSGLAWALGGVRWMPVLPALAILTWVLALVYAIGQGAKLGGRKLPIITTAFIAATIVFYSLLLAPNRYQVLYWRSGMLPYLAPLIFNTCLAGRLFVFIKRQTVGWLGMFELGLLGFISAGFSETVFALQAGFWGLILLYMLWRRQPSGRTATICILIGTAVGAVLLMINPTNAIRQTPFPDPPPVMTLALTSIRYAFDFVFYSVRASWLPVLALMAAGMLTGWLAFAGAGIHWRSALKLLAGLLAGTAVLLIAMMAPTVWSMSAYPGERALMPGVYLITLLFFAVGGLTGAAGKNLLWGRLPARLNLALALAVMLLISAYLIHFVPSVYAPVAAYKNRAASWDARNAHILQARAGGQTRLTVPGMDSIAAIFELRTDEGHWVNRCAAQYYQLNQINTDE